MEQRKRRKLCPHCDGEVEVEVIVCPYCGKDVAEQKLHAAFQSPTSAKAPFSNSLSAEQTLSSLYPPPYRPKMYDQEMHKEEEQEEVIPPPEKVEDKAGLTPIVLFSVGINLLFFGLFVFLFSSKGELFLKLNGHLSILYVLAACPLLYFGYRKLS